MEDIGSVILLLAICPLVAILGRKRTIGYKWSLVLCIFMTPVFAPIIILCCRKRDFEFSDNKLKTGKGMKIVGICIIVWWCLSLLLNLMFYAYDDTPFELLYSSYNSAQIWGKICGYIGPILFGCFLIDMANKKKKTRERWEKWNNGDQQ